MKVPKGKTVYSGGKRYKPGDDLPEDLAKKTELEKAPASGGRKRSAAGSGEAGKPSDK